MIDTPESFPFFLFSLKRNTPVLTCFLAIIFPKNDEKMSMMGNYITHTKNEKVGFDQTC